VPAAAAAAAVAAVAAVSLGGQQHTAQQHQQQQKQKQEIQHLWLGGTNASVLWQTAALLAACLSSTATLGAGSP
jgi:hypothetical protein